MKRVTKLFSLLLVVSFLVGIIPAGAVRADEEKKYRVELTGEYDLSAADTLVYNYDKMMKKIKLEKVEGKSNEWNLTMYESTTVFLPFTKTYYYDSVDTQSWRGSGDGGYGSYEGYLRIDAPTYELWKQGSDIQDVFKVYNKKRKCVGTLTINLTILPYSAKMERTKLITLEEVSKRKVGFYETDQMTATLVLSAVYPGALISGDVDLIGVLEEHCKYLQENNYSIPKYLLDMYKSKDDYTELLSKMDEYDYDYAGKLLGFDYELAEEFAVTALRRGYLRGSDYSAWENSEDYAEVAKVLSYVNNQLDPVWQKYKKWLRKEYDPEKDDYLTYKEYYMMKILVEEFSMMETDKKRKLEYRTWLQDEYDAEVHGDDPLFYFCMNISVPEDWDKYFRNEWYYKYVEAFQMLHEWLDDPKTSLHFVR